MKVKWIIKVSSESDIDGCSNPVTIPKYNIEKQLEVGDNVIEFTPDTTGKIVYTCWMGMIRSYINVVDDLSEISNSGSDNTSNETETNQASDDDYTNYYEDSVPSCCQVN